MAVKRRKTEDRSQKSETKKQIERNIAAPERCYMLLADEPELAGKLAEALETGRWLITVHFQKRYKPDEPHDLHHYQINKGYPKNDIVQSLKSIISSFIAKEQPTTELEDTKGFY